MNKNPYEILGVAKNATDAEIKKAYHKLVMQHHPDKNAGNKGSEEKFKEINNAFDILKDPQKRAAFDQFGSAAFAGGNGASAGAGGFGGMGGNPFGAGGFEFNFGGFEDMSEMMDEVLRGAGFGGGRGRGNRRGPAEFRGRDMLHTVVIDLKDAFFGKTEKIKFTTNVKCEKCAGHGTSDAKAAPACELCAGSGYVRTRNGFFASETPCPECQGTGRKIKNPCKSCDASGVVSKTRELDVKIPAGIMDGTRIRITGAGEAGPLGGTAGDFYVDVRVRTDAKIERDGDDLMMRVVVPFATLALGGEIEIQTIDDKKIAVKIPSGTQVGERMRMRGMGMPISASVSASARGARGDLYLYIGTEIPKKLSEKQKKALEEFSGATHKKKRGLF